MTLRLGEVVLIRMQFHQATGTKVRPAVVVIDRDGNIAGTQRGAQVNRHCDVY